MVTIGNYLCVKCHSDKEKEFRRLNIASHMRKCGIAKKYAEFEPYELKDPTKGVFLSGKCGVGKTVMAARICKWLILQNREVVFVVVADLLMKIQDMITHNLSVYEFIKNLSKKDVLCLDDLGAEKLTDYTKQIIYMLINEREMHDRQTIITSNYTLEEIAMMIDIRITSRIKGMCICYDLAGTDRRTEKEEKKKDGKSERKQQKKCEHNIPNNKKNKKSL